MDGKKIRETDFGAIMHVEFTQKPSKPWRKIFFARHPKLHPRDSLPELTGRWKNVPIQHLHAYQTICGFPVDNIIPLSYLQVLATPLHIHLLAHSPLSLLGLVHTGQSLHAYRPITSEEKIDLEVRIDGLKQVKRGGEFLVHTDAFVGTEKVWSATATTFTRNLLGHGQDESKETIPEPSDSSLSFSIAEDMGRKYGKISGDFNPIHIHALLAKPFGYKRAIIHGMWSLAKILSLFKPTSNQLDARFIRPIFLPSTVEAYQNKGFMVLRNPENQKTYLWVKTNVS